jgi:hypothetical protein
MHASYQPWAWDSSSSMAPGQPAHHGSRTMPTTPTPPLTSHHASNMLTFMAQAHCPNPLQNVAPAAKKQTAKSIHWHNVRTLRASSTSCSSCGTRGASTSGSSDASAQQSDTSCHMHVPFSTSLPPQALSRHKGSRNTWQQNQKHQAITKHIMPHLQ